MFSNNPRMKKISLLILLAIIIIAVIWVLSWYTKTQKTYRQSQSIVLDYEKWAHVQETIQQEYDRCQQFISQQQGDFGSFQYCEKFLEWSKANNLIRQ